MLAFPHCLPALVQHRVIARVRILVQPTPDTLALTAQDKLFKGFQVHEVCGEFARNTEWLPFSMRRRSSSSKV